MKFLEKGEFSRVAHQKHMFHRLPHHHCHNKDRKCSRTQNLCNKSETLWRIDQRALLDQVQVLYMLRQARARLERCAETLGRHTVETGGKNHFGIHSFAHQLRLEGFRRNLPKQLCQSSVRYSACHCNCMVQRKLSRRNPACIFGAIRNAAFYEHRSLCSCSSPAPAPGISQNNQAGMLPSAPVINPPPPPPPRWCWSLKDTGQEPACEASRAQSGWLATRSTSQVAGGNGNRSPLPSALPVSQGVPAFLPIGNSAAPAASMPQVRTNRPNRSSSHSGNVVPSRISRQCDHCGGGSGNFLKAKRFHRSKLEYRNRYSQFSAFRCGGSWNAVTFYTGKLQQNILVCIFSPAHRLFKKIGRASYTVRVPTVLVLQTRCFTFCDPAFWTPKCFKVSTESPYPIVTP